MNILYISNLSNNIAAGLNWSVPATVNSQSEFDNVMWVNLTNAELPHWREVKAFHQLAEFCQNFDIDLMPSPFNRPDFVVFEGFYHPKDPLIARQLRKRNIRYIIVPRGSLTIQAQKLGGIKKSLKKKLANWLIFNKYVRNAIAIQYLTQAERNEAGEKWNKQSFIVSNGFSIPDKHKETFNTNIFKAIYIGRLDLYHKGLDYLLNGILIAKNYLREQNFSLDIYGPNRYDYEIICDFINKNCIGDLVSLKGEISGKEKETAIINSDLFLLTSRFEGHPMGLVEAVAYGLPALVTPGSNMADVIESYNAGWVCAPNPNSIANSLREIISNRHLLPQKSAGCHRLSQLYDWHNIAELFHNYLQDLYSQSTI